jgi:hypothetical protein
MKSKVTSQAILAGFNSSGAIVFEQDLDLSHYWDESHPVIDESQFRQEKGIRRLVGKLYGSEGQLLQEFESTYDEAGTLESSHARHQDGTETRFPPR